jgi:hypothetical protein
MNATIYHLQVLVRSPIDAKCLSGNLWVVAVNPSSLLVMEQMLRRERDNCAALLTLNSVRGVEVILLVGDNHLIPEPVCDLGLAL